MPEYTSSPNDVSPMTTRRGRRRPAASRALVLVVLGAWMGGLLGGCGYQLRGSEGLPTEVTSAFVKTQSSGLAQALSELLSAAGAPRVAHTDEAQLAIRVRDERMHERLLSVDPNTGKAREYELSYGLAFTAENAAGEPLVERQQVRIVRDYIFDGDAVIGKSRERGVLEAEMRRDAARQIMHRIRAAYRSRR